MKPYSLLRTFSSDLINLIYPQTCVSCEIRNAINNHAFCFFCLTESGLTNHFEEKINDFQQRIHIRIDNVHGAALFNFTKKGHVQKAIHKLKYKSQSQIGVQLGKQLGYAYSQSTIFEKADLIIPVPITKGRMLQRGYNQSVMIAKGIRDITDIPISSKAIQRDVGEESQTKKDRLQRFQNAMNAFTISNPQDLDGKRIIIVDDVLTTGATIEAICLKLHELVNDIKIQILTIALAKS